MKYEVRCCCMPTKLLGHVETDMRMERGRKIVFALAPLSVTAPPETLTTEAATINIPRFNFDSFESYLDGYESHLAIKSNDYPIETWRRVAGFTEINK